MLGGNQLKNESSRFTWQTADSNDFIRMNAEVTGKSESLALDSIVMSPMQIRTFSVTAIANWNFGNWDYHFFRKFLLIILLPPPPPNVEGGISKCIQDSTVIKCVNSAYIWFPLKIV